MKKKMSKAISILLVSLMLVAMFPTAFAAEPATVTVSMKDTGVKTTAVSVGATLWTGYEDSIRVAEGTDITLLNWITGHKIPRAVIGEGKKVFSVDVKAAAGTYAVSLTPITSGRGTSFHVWVDGQFAGRVDTRDTSLGVTEYVKASSARKLNTLAITPDDEGWVNIKFEVVSTRAELADGNNDTIGFSDITLTPAEAVTYSGIDENISGKDLFAGKTLDFVISANMSDGNPRYFNPNDENNYITAVADGSSVTISDTVMKEDGLHGKVTGVTADVASTITVTTTLDGVAQTPTTISVTPQRLEYTKTTLSMVDDGITFATALPGNGTIDLTTNDITWNDGKTALVEEKTKIGYLRKLTLRSDAGIGDSYGYYRWPIGPYGSATAALTFRTKLADGAYGIDITPIMSDRGSIYGVWVNGEYAGSIDSYEDVIAKSVANNANSDRQNWYSAAYAGKTVSLNTIDISDSDGWVEVKIATISKHPSNATVYESIGFKDIVFTPADKPAVSSLSENISTTEIYNGERYDFYIKAVMNDGKIHKFDTSDTTNKITATVSSGSAVKLSNMVMKEDGLYGKITGVGEDEKATITVKTIINGVTDTKTIDVISFATEVRTPETVAVSMACGGEIATTTASADRYVFESTDKITWGDSDKIRLDYDKTVITNFRKSTRGGGIWYPVVNSTSTSAGFTVKVRATEGTYKVDATRAYSPAGCVYEIFVDGKSVGTIDGSGKLVETDGSTDVTIGEKVSLDTVSVTPDENGWVEITVKYNSDGAVTTGGGTSRYILFKDITLTPTQKVYVTAETPSGLDNSLITCEGYTPGTIADVAFKTNLVLTATETETNKFLYWINNSTKQVISEEAILPLSVTSNATISAVYSESGNARYDYFTSTGQRIASYFGSAPATAPEIPSAVGYTAGGEWTEDNAYETDDYVAYAPDYTNVAPLTFDTTIDGEEKTVTYDEKITVTAEDADFSYWTKGGKAVSFMSSYTFFAWGDEIVEKICGVSVPAKERKPQVVLFNRGNDYMLELVACEDVEVIEKGILFAENGTPTIGSAITKAKSNSDSLQFTASSEYSVARAYLVYRDDDGVKVVYSDVIK